jgi:hypothetical protein
MIDLGKQWPLNISFFADKCKCLVFASLDTTEPQTEFLLFFIDKKYHLHRISSLI